MIRYVLIAQLGWVLMAIAWAHEPTGALAQGSNELKFELISGPNEDPLVWRVLMNDDMYRRFVTTGLAERTATGPLRPNTWLGRRGRYFPMQYIGRRGNLHELRLVQSMRTETPAVSPAATGCCAWRLPNGAGTCTQVPPSVCHGEHRGTFFPNYSCKITGGCSP